MEVRPNVSSPLLCRAITILSRLSQFIRGHRFKIKGALTVAECIVGRFDRDIWKLERLNSSIQVEYTILDHRFRESQQLSATVLGDLH